MNRFVCGVVTFFPDNEVIKKIDEYSKIFDNVLVFDNTPQRSDKLKAMVNKPNIYIYSNGENNGLSEAYNFFMKRVGKKFDFLCTMDQDSNFSRLDINAMFNYINKHDMSKVAVVGPEVKYKDGDRTDKENSASSKNYLISSGSFLNLSLLRLANIHFDSNYFIDRVDADFCKQCQNMGYQVIEYSGSVLYQVLGQRTRLSKFGNHSYKRHYYMFRNRFYFNNKFISNGVKRILIDWLESVKHCSRILFLENQKCKKLQQIVFALKDYKQNNMGSGRY